LKGLIERLFVFLLFERENVMTKQYNATERNGEEIVGDNLFQELQERPTQKI
jgi:hypothetical protein